MLNDDLEACLAFLKYPTIHHSRIRTINLLERDFAEQRRRAKIIPHFFSEKSCPAGLRHHPINRAIAKAAAAANPPVRTVCSPPRRAAMPVNFALTNPNTNSATSVTPTDT